MPQLPEFIYPLNLLLRSASFMWLDYQIRKDNPESKKTRFNILPTLPLLYGTFCLRMLLTFIAPILSIYLIGAAALTMFIWTFVKRKN